MFHELIPNLPLPHQAADKITWELPSGSSYFALGLTTAALKHKGLFVVVCADANSCQRIAQACQFYTPEMHILTFPDWETLPYDQFSPHPDIIAQRLSTLYRLGQLTQGILLVPANTLAQRLSPPEFLRGHTFVLKKGDIIVIDTFRQQLEQASYRNVTQVLEPGEFAIRGSVLDIFPMSSVLPLRIDLFDNEVDSIRTFDPETQRSAEPQDKIEILPAREFPLTDDAIKQFRQRWRETFTDTQMDATIYKEISTRVLPPGIEYYLPLFFKSTATLFDYLPSNSTCVYYSDVTRTLDQFWNEVQERHNQLRHDRLQPILAPNLLFIPTEEIYQRAKAFNQIRVKSATQSIAFPDLTINHKSTNPLSLLEYFLATESENRFLFCCESIGRREAVSGLLKTINCFPQTFNHWNDFLTSEKPYGICVASLDTGIQLPNAKIILITESQLYGERVWQERRRKRRTGVDYTDSAIRNLAELQRGDLIVHIEHGIGRYLGLTTLVIENQPVEFLQLEYANNDKLYVPITSLHLISRYSGAELSHTVLNRLGNPQWQKTKRQAAEQLRDVAAELLELYAKRAAKSGFAFQAPGEDYQLFSEEFPFEETPDQEIAIEHVISDMTRSQPMDRLVCGDVGFGKTEVAMRAAFLATQSHKQVAVLVPTTLLAQQHYTTFSDRFAEWPVRVEMISRFRTAKEQQTILSQLQEGKIDIIIGTHKLLADNIYFKNLGLVIIDEEHRFGVSQKEKMKKLRAEVDILTLTATPIPRTLNMALSSIRDLSIIATPPQKRLAVKTFVKEHNNMLVREAILREILRGGQVYYLHNDVANMNKVAEKLAALAPEAKIEIAHGQMREKQLEHIMSQFYHQKFNVLLCTTIIETGIDIPSANTIIIDRADKFGLAQLHQLRGRVGRSHHQAYAYLFVPPQIQLSTDAEKRLDAIVSLEDLGAGFALASHDLEIRGAGELLGDEQSGNMQALGFTLYMELLEETVAALKSGKIIDIDIIDARLNNVTEIDLHVPALIPENYLPDIQLRLVFYKRIASVNALEQLTDLQVEMIDRFGLLPTPIKNLFEITTLRLQAEKLGIRKIDLHAKGGKITFLPQPTIDPLKLVQLIQREPKKYKLQGTQALLINLDLPTAEDRILLIEELLKYL